VNGKEWKRYLDLSRILERGSTISFFQVIGHDFLLCFMFTVFKVDNARRMIPDSWGHDVLCLTDCAQSGELHLKL
jgi:hypothetical protein